MVRGGTMIGARVAADGRGGFRYWWNSGTRFGWSTCATFDDALAEAVRRVVSLQGGGPVRVSSDGVRARVVGVA